MTTPDENATPTRVFGPTPPTAFGGSAPSLAGVVLEGAYQVEAKLGEGGMGTVYRGLQLSLGRAVAIKTLSPEAQLTDAAVQRFFREAKILSQLSHPNIVSIIDFGTATPLAAPFIVMELLQGMPLDAYVREDNRPPLRQVLNLMGQICTGVAAAHQANIIHRDLKPSNVFLVPVAGAVEPVVKLLDFGLAKPAARMPESGRAITQAGIGLGTCGFTAPEQLEGLAEPDERADVYGLGAILYFLLTGRPPYQGETVNSVLVKQMTKPPDAIDFAALGLSGCEAMEPVLLKAMSIQPQDRYQSVAEFKGALEAILTGIVSNPQFRTARGVGQTTWPSHTGPARAGTMRGKPGRRRLWFAAGALILLATAVLAAWLIAVSNKGPQGTEGDGTRPDKPELTATAPGVSATEITLGMSAPFSGPAKELGRDMQTGIDTYLSHINETRGGIHGRKVKLLALDDGYDPKRCAETMNDMIRKRPVFAFIGNVGTPTAEVSVPMILEHKRALFGAFTGAGLLRRDPPDRYVFNYRPSYAEETAAIVKYLLTVRKVLPEQIAVFAQQDGYGDAGFNGVAKALRKGGFDTDRILRVGYQRNAIDIEEAARTLLKHKDRIKAVVMVPTYAPAAAFIKRLRDAGMNPIFTSVSFVGSGALAEELKSIAPQFAKGIIITQVVPFPWSSATGVLNYRERLARFYPAEAPGFVSLEGYIAAQLLCAGLEKAGPELSTEKFVEALESIRDLDLSLGTQISFGPSDHQGSHKVWATVLDDKVQFQSLDLE